MAYRKVNGDPEVAARDKFTPGQWYHQAIGSKHPPQMRKWQMSMILCLPTL